MRYDDIKLALKANLAAGQAPTALVVSPTTREIISSVRQALREGYIREAILLGDPALIPLAVDDPGHGLRIHAVDGEEAILATLRERLLQRHKDLVIKGNISSGKLLRAVLSASTHQDDRLSHLYLLDSKSFPDWAIVISDAGVNIDPDLPTKAKIIDNAVQFARAIGFDHPRIALLSAVETVNPAMQSSLDAAALRAMAEGGRFPHCHIDGPMAIDAALSPRSATAKSLTGEVAGRADVLICPNIDSANSTAKALIGTTGRAMGVIYGGAGVPVAFPSRGDSEETRLDSILLAASLAVSPQASAQAAG